MKVIEKPLVFHVAQTRIIETGMQSYLDALDIPDWCTDAPSDAERLLEVFGRGCYRSFQVGMNRNVTKIREGNKPYLANIQATKHGSVIEHASDSYVFLYVSRVFTHELVRNRIGNSFSQESLRYVRLDDLKGWFPKVFQDHPKRDELFAFHRMKFELLEGAQVEISRILDIDNVTDFKTKKKLTSAMRRYAPIGLATMIAYTGNHRSLRWAIEQRTDDVAEEEIRLAFGEVAEEQRRCYPNLYQDMRSEMADGMLKYSFGDRCPHCGHAAHSKI
jgi:thymidylate synthase (FAD)